MGEIINKPMTFLTFTASNSVLNPSKKTTDIVSWWINLRASFAAANLWVICLWCWKSHNSNVCQLSMGNSFRNRS